MDKCQICFPQFVLWFKGNMSLSPAEVPEVSRDGPASPAGLGGAVPRPSCRNRQAHQLPPCWEAVGASDSGRGPFLSSLGHPSQRHPQPVWEALHVLRGTRVFHPPASASSSDSSAEQRPTSLRTDLPAHQIKMQNLALILRSHVGKHPSYNGSELSYSVFEKALSTMILMDENAPPIWER